MEMLNFNAKLVKKGTKTQNESYPELRTVSTVGNFKLNNKALSILGVVPGEGHVALFDMFGPDTESQEGRYFVANGDAIEGSVKVGKNKIFSHSTVYSTILLGDPKTQSATKAVLMDAGKLVDDNDGIAREVVSFELVPYNDGNPVQVGDAEVVVYELARAKRTERSIEDEE